MSENRDLKYHSFMSGTSTSPSVTQVEESMYEYECNNSLIRLARILNKAMIEKT